MYINKCLYINRINISNREKKGKFSEISYFLKYFSKFSFEKIMTSTTTKFIPQKQTLTTIIKENNHFLCMSQALKFHKYFWRE